MCSYGQRSMCADLLNSYERTYFLDGRIFCLQCRKCIRRDAPKIYRKSRVGRWRQWVLKAYKYRIYPNSEQRIQIAKTFGCCRFVYNQTLAYRKDIYELPPDSIRELIINAVMNCSFLQNSHIQVAIYDDRLEITSPGGFMPGVTLDKMKEGYSKIRNRALAHAFSYMNLIEAWGSGIPKLMEAMQEYGLREPEFRDMEIGFRINLYRNMEETRMGTDQGVQKVDQDIQKLTDDAVKISVYTEYNLTDKSKAVLALIKEQPDITEREIAAQLGWKINRVKYQIDKMKSQNVIQRIGTSQKGYWKILIENSSF